MSSFKRKHPKRAETLSEQKTLPIQAPDARQAQTNAAEQSPANVERVKRWGEEHGS
jgi:hypothetical protein